MTMDQPEPDEEDLDAQIAQVRALDEKKLLEAVLPRFLRLLRKRADLGQREAGNRLGWKHSTISDLEHDDRQLTLPEFFALVIAYGKEPPEIFSELFDRVEEERNRQPKIQANRKLLHEQFRSLVLGLKRDQLLLAIGRPDNKQKVDDKACWIYENVATDPATRRPSPTVQIVWIKNRVHEVKFT